MKSKVLKPFLFNFSISSLKKHYFKAKNNIKTVRAGTI